MEGVALFCNTSLFPLEDFWRVYCMWIFYWVCNHLLIIKVGRLFPSKQLRHPAYVMSVPRLTSCCPYCAHSGLLPYPIVDWITGQWLGVCLFLSGKTRCLCTALLADVSGSSCCFLIYHIIIFCAGSMEPNASPNCSHNTHICKSLLEPCSGSVRDVRLRSALFI